MKTSPITFCNSSVDQLIDHPTKTLVVETIRQLTELSPETRTCKIVRTPRDVGFLKNGHLAGLATRGQRFWLYLTQIQHANVCLLVERSIKPGYPYPKMLVVRYQFNDTLHQNTLMEVEVLSDAGGCDAPLILLSDLLVLKNRDVRNWDPIRRFTVMHTMLEKQYHENMVLQPASLQVKRLFAATDWDQMLQFAQSLPYPTRGLTFYPMNTRFPVRLWLDDTKELDNGTGPVRTYHRGGARGSGTGTANGPPHHRRHASLGGDAPARPPAFPVQASVPVLPAHDAHADHDKQGLVPPGFNPYDATFDPYGGGVPHTGAYFPTPAGQDHNTATTGAGSSNPGDEGNATVVPSGV